MTARLRETLTRWLRRFDEVHEQHKLLSHEETVGALRDLTLATRTALGDSPAEDDSAPDETRPGRRSAMRSIDRPALDPTVRERVILDRDRAELARSLDENGGLKEQLVAAREHVANLRHRLIEEERAHNATKEQLERFRNTCADQAASVVELRANVLEHADERAGAEIKELRESIAVLTKNRDEMAAAHLAQWREAAVALGQPPHVDPSIIIEAARDHRDRVKGQRAGIQRLDEALYALRSNLAAALKLTSRRIPRDRDGELVDKARELRTTVDDMLPLLENANVQHDALFAVLGKHAPPAPAGARPTLPAMLDAVTLLVQRVAKLEAIAEDMGNAFWRGVEMARARGHKFECSGGVRNGLPEIVPGRAELVAWLVKELEDVEQENRATWSLIEHSPDGRPFYSEHCVPLQDAIAHVFLWYRSKCDADAAHLEEIRTQLRGLLSDAQHQIAAGDLVERIRLRINALATEHHRERVMVDELRARLANAETAWRSQKEALEEQLRAANADRALQSDRPPADPALSCSFDVLEQLREAHAQIDRAAPVIEAVRAWKVQAMADGTTPLSYEPALANALDAYDRAEPQRR